MPPLEENSKGSRLKAKRGTGLPENLKVTLDAVKLVCELEQTIEVIRGLAEPIKARVHVVCDLEKAVRFDADGDSAAAAYQLRAEFKPTDCLGELVRTLRALQSNGLIVEHNGEGWVLRVAGEHETAHTGGQA